MDMDHSSSFYEKIRTLVKDERLPLAYVDLKTFDENAESLAKRSHPLPIRVASKSVRCLELLKRVLKHSSYRGVLAYSGHEAVELLRSDIDDIVVAYPVVNRVELKSVAEAIRLKPSIVLMTDRPDQLERLNEVATEMNVTFEIAVDLDVSSRWPGIFFGVRRSWISSEARLADYLMHLKKFPRLKLVGAMGYEAQIAGVSDESALMRFLKSKSVADVKKNRIARIAQIKAAGHALRFVNGGGTGSLESTRLDSSVTELSAGSGLYQSTLFDAYQSFHALPAAGFILEVTRKPEENFATCFSGGYIASGTVGIVKQPTPVYPQGLSLLKHEGAGEVQSPVTGIGAQNLKVGDTVFFRHAKAGELCERFNELLLISGDQYSKVKTYRGEGWNFG
jgi:D-serine deaminase-like pyridoxal phosphate-dependent protein